MSLPLFARVLGDVFEDLPPTVRTLHAASGERVWIGEAEIVRGNGWLARLCAIVARLPPSSQSVPVRVRIHSGTNGEHWRREFGLARMPSRLWFASGRLREQLGLVRFDFRLTLVAGRLDWRVVAVRLLGLPLPSHGFAAVRATEFERDGRYCFKIDAVLPWVGRIVRYADWFDVRTADMLRE